MAIKYNKLFELMKTKGISSYYILKKSEYKIGNATYDKLKNNEHVDTRTIEKLCIILDCQPGDLMEYIPDIR